MDECTPCMKKSTTVKVTIHYLNDPTEKDYLVSCHKFLKPLDQKLTTFLLIQLILLLEPLLGITEQDVPKNWDQDHSQDALLYLYHHIFHMTKPGILKLLNLKCIV